MQTSTRRQVLWDPLGSDRFIVGSSNQIKLYQWDSKDRGINVLASQSDPVNMRCLAWSPHSMVDDLVAVGLATGNVQLLRMGSNIEPFPDQYQDWEGPKVPMLPTKYPRPCQALGFSTIDPNYLAVGLDIARNDPGLLIWDIERSTRSTSPPGSDFPAIQRVVLPSTKPTLNLNGPGDTRPLQYYCLAESVHSLAFLQGSPHLLIAAIGRKQVGMYDLRFAGTINTFSYNTGGGNNNRPTFYSTKSVHGIAVDPLDDNYFASFGDGTAISLWDRRSSSPVMTWAEEDARSGADSSGKSISTIQFSKSRRGELGSLLKGAHVVRLWDTLDHRREALADHTTTSNISIVSPWMENGTLLEYIAKNPEVNRFQLCIQVSAGLAHLHESDNVHGDVKSPNVLISENGVAKLTDFGNTALKKYTLEFTGTTSGSNISVRWTAPEVLVGDSAYTKEADIYALGMVSCPKASNVIVH
ncbi:hypothetical protein FS749_008725 [Ceratobasidium sp. UAMH 11750]|nr:hypothetical protein FS749_008725 [Ceratobasidium sp. UAMH 11750]